MLKFHQCCGDNIKLSNNRAKVWRYRSFANALVFSQRPIEEEELFLIEIDETGHGWAGNLRLGVTFHNPLNTTIPPYLFPDLNQLGKSYLFPLKQSIEDPFNDHDTTRSSPIIAENMEKPKPSIIVIERSPENTFSPQINKDVLVKSNEDALIKPCDKGSRIGLFISKLRDLYFLVNGVQYGPCARNIPKSLNVYVAIDLYGNTTKVKIINCYVPKLSTLCKDAIFNAFDEDDIEDWNIPKIFKRDLLSLYAQ